MIRQPTASETALLKGLWARCFSDTSEEQAWYFENLYQPRQVLADFEGDCPVAMLQKIPAALQVGEKAHSAAYIYGVCTHPDYRRQGRMARLLKQAEEGVDYLFLKPENPVVYQPFGYVSCSAQAVFTKAFPEKKGAFCDCPTADELNGLWQQYLSDFPFGALRDAAWWRKAVAFSGHARTLLRNGVPVAYAVYGDGAVDELVSFDRADTAVLLGSISQGTPITVRTPSPWGEGYAMVKTLNNAPALEGSGCFGLLFD